MIPTTPKGVEQILKPIVNPSQYPDSYQPYFFDVAILHQIQNESLLEPIEHVGKRIYRRLI
jgi:hypothetical protein